MLCKGAAVLTRVPNPDTAPTLTWLSEPELEQDANLVKHGGIFVAGGGASWDAPAAMHSHGMHAAAGAHALVQA